MSISTITKRMETATSAQLGRWLDKTARLATGVAREFGKHWIVTALLLLFFAYVFFWFTVTLIVTVVVVLALAVFGSFWLWGRDWKNELAANGREIPSWRELWEIRAELEKRQELLLTEWPRLCIMHGLRDNKRTPLLMNVKPTLDRDFTAFSPRTGFDPDDIKAKAPKIAKGLGCKGGILVRETSFGACEIKFNWSNPIRREIPLRELKMPVKGGIAFGHTETGEPAELRIDASKTFVGVQGSGKSVGAEASLADLVRRRVPVRLRVSNPKKNEMRMFNQFVKQSQGTLEVRAYAETQEENIQLVKDAANAMSKRSQMMKGRKLVVPTMENPLDILWLDEMMMLPKEVYKDGPYSPLGQILVAGRASLNVVWGCTQMFYASEFGSLRGLFDERILMRVKTQLQNDMVIEDATKRGALAHRIHPRNERGVGYIEDEHGELTKFRAAKVEDEDLERIIRGQIPEGMITEATKVVEAKPVDQSVYFIEAQGTDLVKIGIAAVPKDRLKELQTASPHKLSIITTMPGGKAHESHLHRKFHATRATGEWFHRTPELDAYIAEVKAGGHRDPAVKPAHPALHPRQWMAARTIQRNEPTRPKQPQQVRAPKPTKPGKVRVAVPAGPDFLPWERNYKPTQHI